MLEIWAMVPPISLMAATDSCVAPCMPRICEDISSVAFAVWLASDLTSEATTAKPRPALRGVRGSRQRSRSLFKLNGGSRNVRDDRADGRLEIIGKANQLSAARGAARPVLGILGGGIAFGFGDRLHLELFDRARHLAEFVAAAEPRQHDIEIAVGEFAHCLAHRDHRPGDLLAEQQRQC